MKIIRLATVAAIAFASSFQNARAVEILNFAGELIPPDFVVSQAEQLGLTDEQVHSIKTSFEDLKSRFGELEKQMSEAGKELHIALQQHPINPNVAKAKLATVLEVESEIKQLQLGILLGARNLLNESQLIEAKKLFAAHAKGRQNPRAFETRMRPKMERLKQMAHELAELTGGPPQDILEKAPEITALLTQGRPEEAERLLEELLQSVQRRLAEEQGR